MATPPDVPRLDSVKEALPNVAILLMPKNSTQSRNLFLDMAIPFNALRLGMVKEALPNNQQSLPMPKNLYTSAKEALPQRGNTSRLVINQIVSSVRKHCLKRQSLPATNLK